MPLRFCANLSFQFQESSSFVERYRSAKFAGFKAVESAFPVGVSVQELVTVQQETGLQQILFNIDNGTVVDGGFGCASFLNAESEFRDNLENTITYAKALNCQKVHVTAGKHETPTDQRHENVYISNLRFAAGRLAQEGILCIIEPINKYTIPGYYLNNFEQALRIIQTVNNNNLKLMYDLFHVQHIQGNFTRSLEEVRQQIGHVQIAQTPGRNEPDSNGEANLRYVLKEVEKNYDGWVGCEYRPLSGTIAGLKWITDWGYEL